MASTPPLRAVSAASWHTRSSMVLALRRIATFSFRRGRADGRSTTCSSMGRVVSLSPELKTMDSMLLRTGRFCGKCSVARTRVTRRTPQCAAWPWRKMQARVCTATRWCRVRRLVRRRTARTATIRTATTIRAAAHQVPIPTTTRPRKAKKIASSQRRVSHSGLPRQPLRWWWSLQRCHPRQRPLHHRLRRGQRCRRSRQRGRWYRWRRWQRHRRWS
mmetsp:Transcript_37753/g.103744  ORF Transcript_37753/g.103744 Transcript_37753/m.103744 type:complete len:217 (-) Transcript_37753:316-966(-)